MRAVRIAGFCLVVMVACFMPSVSGDITFPGDKPVLQWGPVLTNMTTDSVTISWATKEPVRGTVAYAEMTGHVPGFFEQTVTEGNASGTHRIRLDNLSPDQTYMYSVFGDSREHTFRTFPKEGPVRFVVYGDTREQLPMWNQSTHHALVASRIAAEPDIRFVVHTGDLVNDPSDDEEWGRFFSAAGPVIDHVPFYPVAGNHEGSSGVIQEIFDTPPWYVVLCGDARVVVLDSNPLSPAMMAEQERFISEIPGREGNWMFAAIHHPLYSADPNHPGGFRDVRKMWEPVFISWGVRAVFAAHVHAYEHVERSGIHYFTVATGGAPSYQLSREKPEGYVTGLENTLGYAVVTVDSTTGIAVVEFVQVAGTSGLVLDIYPERTVYERVVLARQGSIAGLHFPAIFTSRFGDTKITLLSKLS